MSLKELYVRKGKERMERVRAVRKRYGSRRGPKRVEREKKKGVSKR